MVNIFAVAVGAIDQRFPNKEGLQSFIISLRGLAEAREKVWGILQ